MFIIGTCSSIATFAFSVAPGINNVAPIPNGLSVCERIFCIAFRVSSAFNGPVANIPTPPYRNKKEERTKDEEQKVNKS